MQQEKGVGAGDEATDINVALQELSDMHARNPQHQSLDKAIAQPDMVRRYYDAVTELYEYGWTTSFHFAPHVKSENLAASQRRLQEDVAGLLNLEPGMIVADIGCGVGGPLLYIA